MRQRVSLRQSGANVDYFKTEDPRLMGSHQGGDRTLTTVAPLDGCNRIADSV